MYSCAREKVRVPKFGGVMGGGGGLLGPIGPYWAVLQATPKTKDVYYTTNPVRFPPLA